MDIEKVIEVQNAAAGAFVGATGDIVFNMYRNRPLLREGGVMIFSHPVYEKFHPIHHPSYIDFYEQVLPETRDPKEIEAGWEETFARDPRYVDLYRHSYAYHGVHPFYMWYWACHGQSHAGRVIYVAPESKRAVERIDLDASTLEPVQKLPVPGVYQRAVYSPDDRTVATSTSSVPSRPSWSAGRVSPAARGRFSGRS